MNACVAHGPGRGGALPRWHRGCDVANEKKTSKYFHRRHRNEKRGGGGGRKKLVFFNQPLITFTDG